MIKSGSFGGFTLFLTGIAIGTIGLWTMALPYGIQDQVDLKVQTLRASRLIITGPSDKSQIELSGSTILIRNAKGEMAIELSARPDMAGETDHARVSVYGVGGTAFIYGDKNGSGLTIGRNKNHKMTAVVQLYTDDRGAALTLTKNHTAALTAGFGESTSLSLEGEKNRYRKIVPIR